MSKQIKEFVIVGGGSAGWVAASCLARLLLKTPLGNYKITLVESSEIPIIGVGEATIPSIQDVLSFLNIDEADFVRSTNATYKLGIKFKDWSKIGEDYFHPFGDMGPMIENQPLHHHWLQNKVLNPNLTHIDNISICTIAAEQNKFQKPSQDKQSVNNWLSYAYHFDAGLVAEYLKNYSKAKGVNHIIGTIEEVKKDEGNGFIKTLKLNDGREISGDFFFDCSGFAALLIEKSLGSNFEDWTDFLPVDRAIAMPSETKHPITPYTLTTAREAGWTWRIPLQSRIGNGYVYSSKFIDDEKAANDLKSFLDSKPIADPRIIKFRAGRRKEPWVKNCLSLGLSSGFVEPLESTAIHLVIANVFRFFDHLPKTENLETLRNAFIKRGISEIEEIRDFIILHYCVSKRDDSEFWKYVTNMEIPDSLKSKLDIYMSQAKILADYYDLFRPISWVAVLVGMNVIPKGTNPLLDVIPSEFSTKIINDVSNAIHLGVKSLPSHEEYISRLINRN